MDGIRQVNNPSRVPSTLSAIDGPQEGTPRVIHPMGMLVGKEGQDMGLITGTDNTVYFEVPEDGTYIRRDGGSFWYPKGHRLTIGEAALFEAFDAPKPAQELAPQEVVNERVRALLDEIAALKAEKAARDEPDDFEVGHVELPPVSGGEGEPVADEPKAEERQEAAPENRMENAPENRVESAPSNRATKRTK